MGNVLGGGNRLVLVTSFRPDPAYPQMVAGVAWIDHARTTTWLYPGLQEPSITLPSRGPEEVPTDMRSRLAAAFNSGFTLQDSGAIRVWRSGVGIDRRGNLIYAATNDQTVGSLTAILMRAGAVRAAQLDINTDWVSFISYRHPGAIGAANLLPNIDRSSQRYLTPDDRDFFAVYLR